MRTGMEGECNGWLAVKAGSFVWAIGLLQYQRQVGLGLDVLQ